MGGPRLLLRKAVYISQTSVFFTPEEGSTLDLQTLSSAPKAHRSHLQKCGFVAKVMLSLSAQSTLDPQLTPAERLKLWWTVLQSSGVTESDALNVTVPITLRDALWPILDEDVLLRRMEIASRLEKDEVLQECPYIVPVLSVERFVHKDTGMKATLGVIWMPWYKYNLLHWSEKYLQEQQEQIISEKILKTLIQQIIIGLLGMQKSLSTCLPYLTMEDIVVADEEDESPSFLLIPSNLGLIRIHDLFKRKSLGTCSFLPPEFNLSQSRFLSHTKTVIWSLGIIVYQMACGISNFIILPATDLSLYNTRRKHELPLNDPRLTPSDIIRRVRRDLQSGSYSNILIHVLVLMLGQDCFTRPSLILLDRMLSEVHRSKPILRFPFVIGQLNLIRVTNAEKNILIDPNRKKYMYRGICLLCGKNRSRDKCKNAEHKPVSCSPLWYDDELLPEYTVATRSYMTHLFPLVGKLEKRKQRRYIEAALQTEPMDQNALLQLFGGFAVVQMKGNDIITHEVLVPIPDRVLKNEDNYDVATRLSFTAAFPWPSECTAQLQQSGRIMRAVPAIFGIQEASWYTWILPGETFSLNGTEWVPTTDGGFVFWFNENLEPTELDRYFLLCGVQSMSLKAKVECTTPADKVFKRFDKDKEMTEQLSYCEFPPLASTSAEEKENRHRHSRVSCRTGTSRRGTHISDINIPMSSGVYDAVGDDKLARSGGGGGGEKLGPLPLQNMDSLNVSPIQCKRTPGKNTRTRMNSVDCSIVPFANIKKSSYEGVLQPLPAKSIITMVEEEAEREGDDAGSMKEFYKKNEKFIQKLSKKVEDGGNARKSCTKIIQQQDKTQFLMTQPAAIMSNKNKTPPKVPTSLSSASEVNMTQPPLPPLLPSPANLKWGPKGASVKVFGRWFPSNWVDAAFQSLTFCIPNTGENGRLSTPVKISEATRLAMNAPENAVSMVFCSNEVSIIQRDHKNCVKALPPGNISGIVPHHAFVFYDCCNVVIGLLALRFGLTSLPNLAHGEYKIHLKTLPPVHRTSVLVDQLNPAYFSGNASFDSMDHVKNDASRMDGNPVHQTSSTHNMTGADNASQGSYPQLSLSGPKLLCFGDSAPKVKCPDDEAFPFCWVGFDPSSQLLMLAGPQQEVWHPYYFSME